MGTDDFLEAFESHHNPTPVSDLVVPTGLILSSMTIYQLKRHLQGSIPGVAKKNRTRPKMNKRKPIHVMIRQKERDEHRSVLPLPNNSLLACVERRWWVRPPILPTLPSQPER